jgi:putative ABC transport system substrate-binding protein
MKRREFITFLGSTAMAWPHTARAQQSAMPVVGYMSSRTAGSDALMLVAFRRGLNEAGFVEGRNVAIEYRFADGDYDRLPALLADFTRQRVSVIVFAGLPTNLEDVIRHMQASPIPIVFNTGGDPVRSGLVASLNNPGGNLTGVNTLVTELSAKLLGLLLDLVPKASTITVLINPSGGAGALQDTRAAAAVLGLQLLVLNANTVDEIDTAFATLNQRSADAMLVAVSPFFLTRAQQIAALAARHRIPTIYPRREFAEAGGLMSYGYNVADGYREMGRYASLILKGEKPANLPVFQPTGFEFVINRKTAKALGLTIPDKLLAIANEVID